MKTGYLDCFSGISGDMLLGALVHAGAPVETLRETLRALDLGASLSVREVDRSGIHSVKVDILVGGHAAEGVHHHGHPPHSHPHSHGRSLREIQALLDKASLPDPVRETSRRAFALLGASEAKIHHVPIESIHFHEVGAVDAIADIVLASAAVHALGIEAWTCSPLNVGGGTVQCAHGRFPVPAPATADLLQGAPTYASGIEMELTTPTGAALVRALGCAFGPLPAMRVEAIGYGAGHRDPRGFPNVVRLSIGRAEGAMEPSEDEVAVLEASLDDLTPQVLAYVLEKVLAEGALDSFCAPVTMKKGRPGHLLTVLASPRDAERLALVLFRETSTLGVRLRRERRLRLERRSMPVETEWGTVRVKVGRFLGNETNAAPEFEDCRRIAETRQVPLKRVMEAALQAYRNTPHESH